MSVWRVAILPGDGVGPEVTRQAEMVLDAVGELFGYRFEYARFPIGAEAVRATRSPLPPLTRAGVLGSDAVLLGAVGHPDFDRAPRALRPETGLLALRQLLGVYANLRPVVARPGLAAASPLKPERLAGVDVLVVRELAGGLYYGEPRGRYGSRAVNTLTYGRDEIERVARVAFDAARERRRRVVSVDKANVLEVSALWREVVTDVAREYPDVTLEHQLVDAAAMRLVTDPARFDVLLTENLFGDILSDEAAVLAGSIGLLPSASLGDGIGLFEPVHGSAPDIAGQDIANPLGTLASVAMLLRHGLELDEAAAVVEDAIDAVLAEGLRTPDLAQPGDRIVGTRAMGEAVAQRIAAGARSAALNA